MSEFVSLLDLMMKLSLVFGSVSLVAILVIVLLAINGEYKHRQHRRRREAELLEKHSNQSTKRSDESGDYHVPLILTSMNRDTSFAAADGSWSSFEGNNDATEAISYRSQDIDKLLTDIRAARDECNRTVVDNTSENVFHQIRDFHHEF